VNELSNLVVDLDERFDAALGGSIDGVDIRIEPAIDDTTLAWIDETFGGWWSSEALAGTNLVARRYERPVGFAAYDPQNLHFAWLAGVAREPGIGIFGPFGVAPEERGGGLGRALLHRALAGLRERGYSRALIPAVGDERLIRFYADAANARVAERFERTVLMGPRVRALVMASGSGTNLQAVLDRSRDGSLPLDVTAVVVNVPGAYAVERARAAHVPSVFELPWKRVERTRADYDAELLELVRAEDPDLVLLLGWMHLLSEPFVRAFPNLLNVHPAFLPLDPQRDDVGMPDGARVPAFRGAYAVRDAFAAGSSWIGATVHVVTPETDRGPVLARKPMRLLPGERQADALARLHPIEHELVSVGIRRWLYER
jgi:phosphoribosylglycinamide formyltransferase-1